MGLDAWESMAAVIAGSWPTSPGVTTNHDFTQRHGITAVQSLVSKGWALECPHADSPIFMSPNELRELAMWNSCPRTFLLYEFTGL